MKKKAKRKPKVDKDGFPIRKIKTDKEGFPIKKDSVYIPDPTL